MTQEPARGGDPALALAALAIVVAQFSITLGAALAKTIFPLVGPEGIAALRGAISALILLALARPWRALPTARQWRWLVLYGLVLGGMNLLIYWAFERIPIGLAVAIEISGPLALVLITSRSLKDLLWLALAVASLAMLIPWPGSLAGLDPLGLVCALGAATCWALYIVFGKRASEVRSSIAVALGMTISCVVTLPIGLVKVGTGLLASEVIWMGIAVAVLSSALPYFLEMRALEKLSSRLFGIITSCAPAVAALVGFLVLGERLLPLQWLAVALMIVASTGCALTSRRPPLARVRDEALT